MNLLHYRGYTGQVEFDGEAGLLFGRVLDLRDTITFEGESVAEVTQAFHDSVDDYLAWCVETGRAPEQPSLGKQPLHASPE